MKSAALSLAILTAAIVLPAQQSSGAVTGGVFQSGPAPQQSFGVAGMENLAPGSQSNGKSLTILRVGTISTCPIAMDARQGNGAHILRARNGQPMQPGMMPTLTLHAPDNKRIVSASITAFGFAATQGTTLLQTANSANLTRDTAQRQKLMRALTLRFQQEDNGEDYSQFQLPGFVTLTSIQLNSVTYNDGGTWNIPPFQHCRAAINPLMLITAGK